MTTTLDAVATSAKEFRKAEAVAREKRAKLRAAILAAAKAGDLQVDIVERSTYKREQVRRVLRAAGFKPDDSPASSG